MRAPAALAALVLAGCIASEGAEPTTGSEAPATLEWRGHLRAGAASDLWAHMAPFADAGRETWRASFLLDVRTVPEWLEVQLDWDASAARLQAMIIGPEAGVPAVLVRPRNADRPEIVNEYTDRSPICMRVPADEIVAGEWAIMAHAEAAVDAKLRFTVRTAAGDLDIVDRAHESPMDGEGRFPAPEDCVEGSAP